VRLPFYSSCVDWPADQLPALMLIADDGHEIGRDWFLRNVAEIPDELRDLAERRWHHHGTTYHRLRREPVFWMMNSLIEYVFAETATIEGLATA
jgi:hypothetical protein